MNILTKIQNAKFMASDADIEALARDRQATLEHGSLVTGTYLKVLVALTAAQVGESTTALSKRRRVKARKLPEAEIAEHAKAFNEVNERCYTAVLRAVTTPDLAPDEKLSAEEQSRRALERNRRSNYARTAASVLRRYIRAGADVRDLDAATVSKQRLRAVAPATGITRRQPSQDTLFKHAQQEIEKAIQDVHALLEVDPVRAKALVHELVEKLQQTERAIPKVHLRRATG